MLLLITNGILITFDYLIIFLLLFNNFYLFHNFCYWLRMEWLLPLMTTRWAGKLTPQARVAVAMSTWIFWLTKSSSTTRRSFSVSPAWWMPTPNDSVNFRLGSRMPAVSCSMSLSGRCTNWRGFSSPESNPQKIQSFNSIFNYHFFCWPAGRQACPGPHLCLTSAGRTGARGPHLAV